MITPSEEATIAEAVFILSLLTKIAADIAFSLDRGTIEEDLGQSLLKIDEMLEDIERTHPSIDVHRQKARAINKATWGSLQND